MRSSWPLHRAPRRAALALAALLAAAPALVAAADAPATPSAAELSAARQLFGEALKAGDAGRWDAALELYERIVKITSSPVVLFQIAVCHEMLGRPVEALNAFEIARQEADRKGVGEVSGEAATHIAALQKKAARVVLLPPKDAAGLRITIDGKPINAVLAGTSMLVDPGARRVIVHADNYAGTFDRTIPLTGGVERQIEVDLGSKLPPGSLVPSVSSATPAPGVAPPVASAAPVSSAPAPPAPPSRVPLVVAGSAALGLGVGAVLTGVIASGKHADYLAQNAHPQPGSHDARDSLRSQGQSLALVSTVLTGGALVAAGVAAYFYLDGRAPAGKPAKAASVSIAPWLGPAGGGLAVGGAL